MQKKKIDTFNQRYLRRNLRVRWQHKITNEEVLRRTGLTTFYTTLMSVPYFGRSRLYEDVCKRDLKSLKNIDIDEWERLTNDRNKWYLVIMKRQGER